MLTMAHGLSTMDFSTFNHELIKKSYLRSNVFYYKTYTF
jgi:hypothetical protein